MPRINLLFCKLPERVRIHEPTRMCYRSLATCSYFSFDLESIYIYMIDSHTFSLRYILRSLFS